jgi:S-DNA-T family DNA segregation ATPase FtsK/SpoIIIE
MSDALTRLRELQAEMDDRYRRLHAVRRRKIVQADGLDALLCVVDELAFFSVTTGTPAEQEEFKTLVRDLVARGRAAGIIIVAATQRPSADIIPTSLRDLFGYRVAFRCTTDSSSDIILAVGWAKEGYSARSIRPEDVGIGWLLAEGGIPRRFKAAYLTDDHIDAVVATALRHRGNHPAA